MSPYYLFLLCLPAAHAGAIVLGLLIRRASGRRLAERVRGSLVLTYDDGPGSVLEPKLLPRLERHGAKATFFLLGERARAAPERASALREAGHEVASHGAAHRHAWKCWPWQAVSDIQRGDLLLEPWRTEPRLFRPPYGKLTLWTWLWLRRSATPIVFWTHATRDTYGRERCTVAEVVEEVRRNGGGVVLLHSFDRGSDPAAEDYVLEVTDALLETARASGWMVSTASQALGLAAR